MRKVILYSAMIAIVAVVLAVMAVLLSVYDKTIARQALGFEDLWLDKPSMRTFDFYPYSGNHIQPHYHQVGPDTWNNQDFDVRSGDHGFFVDFPLDTPPPKQANEFRLILIGGSAAQGWGGRTNEDMFYRQLEQRVNKTLAEQKRVTRLRIINLAMAAAVSYQNFIALNLWGHNLEPDAILSFSGANEFVVYGGYRSNLYFQGQFYGGFERSQRFAESPRWQKFLARYYPGLFSLFGVRSGHQELLSCAGLRRLPGRLHVTLPSGSQHGDRSRQTLCSCLGLDHARFSSCAIAACVAAAAGGERFRL
jgi:hypothetical protein